ncbi:hypothetical protein PVAP13_9NG378214 [Panicum virgatum]|uniref:Uncharacterized protein n=1 Tax=Panicum virgatum TaxID=38727 RepID=A0A8T0MMH5_PANVG|nr:hypothetical protein PVAP13_9NG378214 [Panicum virgatum]
MEPSTQAQQSVRGASFSPGAAGGGAAQGIGRRPHGVGRPAARAAQRGAGRRAAPCGRAWPDTSTYRCSPPLPRCAAPRAVASASRAAPEERQGRDPCAARDRRRGGGPWRKKEEMGRGWPEERGGGDGKGVGGNFVLYWLITVGS